MKKTVIILTLLLAGTTALTACSSDSVSKEKYDAVVEERDEALDQIEALESKLAEAEGIDKKEVSETSKVEKDSDNYLNQITIEELRWSKTYAHNDLVVTNNSKDTLSINFNVLFKDADGNVIGSAKPNVIALGPGEVQYVSVTNDTDFDTAVVSVDSIKEDSRYKSGVSDISYKINEVSDRKIMVEMTNNGKNNIDYAKVFLVFYNDSEVISVNYGFAVDGDNELKAGDTQYAEISAPSEYTSYKEYLSGRYYQ